MQADSAPGGGDNFPHGAGRRSPAPTFIAADIGKAIDRDVVGERPGDVIRLRTMSLFDPNGLRVGVNPATPVPGRAANDLFDMSDSQTACYMIVLGACTDIDRFMSGYQTQVAPLIDRFGGQYILVGGNLRALESTFPGGGGAVISRWPDRAMALAFWNSPEYAEVKKLRERTGEFQVVLVDDLTGAG